MCEGENSIEQLSEILVCLFVEQTNKQYSSISPEQQIGLYCAEAVKLVLDRCISYTPQGQMVLKKRECARANGGGGETADG